MEIATHRDEAKLAKRRIKIKRAALTEAHVGREALCRIRGNSEHLGFGIKTNDLPCEISEPDCELAGPAAKIEHAVILAEADDLSNASDQYRRGAGWGPPR